MSVLWEFHWIRELRIDPELGAYFVVALRKFGGCHKSGHVKTQTADCADLADPADRGPLNKESDSHTL